MNTNNRIIFLNISLFIIASITIIIANIYFDKIEKPIQYVEYDNYTLYSTNRNIYKYNNNNAEIWAVNNIDDHILNGPIKFCVDKNEYLYISNFSNNTIEVLDINGHYIDRLDKVYMNNNISLSLIDRSVIAITGITIGIVFPLFQSNSMNNDILIDLPYGTEKGNKLSDVLGRELSEDMYYWKYNKPRGIAQLSSNDFIVLNSGTDQLIHFNDKMKYEDTWDIKPYLNNNGHNYEPLAIVSDKKNSLLFVLAIEKKLINKNQSKVFVFDELGNYKSDHAIVYNGTNLSISNIYNSENQSLFIVDDKNMIVGKWNYDENIFIKSENETINNHLLTSRDKGNTLGIIKDIGYVLYLFGIILLFVILNIHKYRRLNEVE